MDRIVTPGAAILALTLLAGCAHESGGAPPAASASPVAGGQVGYVLISRLVKKHPLYPQLARLDQDVEALRLQAVASDVAVSPADLEKARRDLGVELDAAAKHAQATIERKQAEMQARESAAIAAALGAAAPPDGASIAQSIDARLQTQQQRVRSDAASDFEAYRTQVIAQDQASLGSLEHSYEARAAREYRAKASALQQAEATYALRLADDDKSERLSLRTNLSNLPLDDTERAATRAQLDALDRKEGDALGAMRNRDQATLSALRDALRVRVRARVAEATASIRAKTIAKIDAHAKTTQLLAAGASGGAIAAAGGANLPPDMKARLQKLQSKFKRDFAAEAQQTVADFQRTKRDLQTRFDRLGGMDRGDDASTQREIAGLQRQRSDLYDQMVAQIQREIRSVAQKRGIDVVFSDVVAPAGGVDLTPEAEKDIESLPQ